MNNLCAVKFFLRIFPCYTVPRLATGFLVYTVIYVILYHSLSRLEVVEKFLEEFPFKSAKAVVFFPLTQRTLLLVSSQHNLLPTWVKTVVNQRKQWMEILIPSMPMDTVHIQNQIPAPAGGAWTWVQIMCQCMKCTLLTGFLSSTMSDKEIEII